MRRLLLTTLLLVPTALAAQATARVEASYVVRRGGKEVGREHIVVRPGQTRGGSVGVRWELDAEQLTGDVVRGVLSQSSDGHLDALQLETRDTEGASVLRAAHRGTRIVISLTGDRIRRSRELPAGEHTVLLDEQLHGLLFAAKELATETGASLVGIYPRTGDRVAFTATKQAGPGGTSTVLLAGGITGRITIAADGLVERLDLPALGLVMERLPS